MLQVHIFTFAEKALFEIKDSIGVQEAYFMVAL